jgi:meso-butanediol dehydrogenase / (S,S)-butanediol dehydrogenase / diacetyl reductase
MDWSKENVVVTGGATGIGRRIAELLAEAGAQVLLADHDGDAGERAAAELSGQGLRVTAAVMDVADEQSVGTVFERDPVARDVTILVNNAAHLGGDGLAEMPAEQWDADIAVVLRGTFLCSRAALAPMRARRRGTIVNIATTNALAFSGAEGYSAAKAGVLSLTRSVAVRYGAEGIRCNAVVPATIVTAAWDSRRARDPQILERMQELYPLGRLGTPDDVARAVRFLCSEDASWITGTGLVLDGGITAGRASVAQIAFPAADEDA